jgi:glycosyltransferase involved in cell wall biosynthesis
MKIAIDATESFWPQLTGTGVYTRQLLRALPAALADDELTVLGIRAAEGDTSFVVPERLRLLRSPRYRSLWSQVRLPLHLLAHRYDVLHVPGHKLPALCRCGSVVTIHDLAFLKFPETFKAGHRQRLEWFTRNSVRRADRIIAISANTKRDLCELLRVDPDRVDVVHHGVDHQRFRPDGPVTLREKPYILSVGALQPRKNYLMLIRAYRQLKRPVELVIAGQRGWMYEEIEREAGNGVVLLGHVSDTELPALYRGAAVVAMPSLYEGFGLPLLEAMACGAPVVASNASCFPEVCGDAAMLVGPDDWPAALAQVLDRPPSRERSLKRAAEFTWEKTAAKTLEVYRKAVG